MDESDDVDEREGDADEDEEAAAEVGEEEERDDDDRQEGQPDVAPQLVPDHLVRLPLGVFLKEGEPTSKSFTSTWAESQTLGLEDDELGRKFPRLIG